MRRATLCGALAAAVTVAACGDSNPASPDFERQLAPGEYQVMVTGDAQRTFEKSEATYQELGTPPFTGFNRAQLEVMDNSGTLNGAEFLLCVPAQPGTYDFDATTEFAGCPSAPGRAMGGFIVQLGAAGADELDCYANGYGSKNFEGVLTITSVTADDVEGEAEGTGICSRHPHSETTPMDALQVTVRVRFRAAMVPAASQGAM